MPLAQLTSFDVPDGAEYSRFLQALKLLISIAQDTERLFKTRDAMVVEIVRTMISSQLSSPNAARFPDALVTKVEPYDTVEFCAQCLGPRPPTRPKRSTVIGSTRGFQVYA